MIISVQNFMRLRRASVIFLVFGVKRLRICCYISVPEWLKCSGGTLEQGQKTGVRNVRIDEQRSL
uniref:Uncharacterized protein n=1 Tax=Rhizophora mucronata TaxID=61149 RepID=A0A2P2QPI3_RHIMU